ncbi:hypothetical protein BpHYR1_011779 [Brachionus plicatilis]|uniref:Uncharacterized protein n=1 Tax=Brachionus plicatilis TaxID=10195 RepID=A0A3M7RTQ0_BRAPC|nr:hypothetical protein BpHYR1_011779 [Brachionus plicatilis]
MLRQVFNLFNFLLFQGLFRKLYVEEDEPPRLLRINLIWRTNKNGELNIKLDSKFNKYISEKEATKFQVYAQLIKNKNDHVIIDLSQKEKNQIDSLKLRSYIEMKSRNEIPMTESGFELIPTYLDVESVRELKIVSYSDTELPTQLFRPFKNLTRFEIRTLFFLNTLNENSFIGLEGLEILELYSDPTDENLIDIKENTFKALINLKLLIFTDCRFVNFHKTNGLENLRELKIKGCSFLEDFRLEYLELCKNLENLLIFDSSFDKSEFKSFNGFEKLKILETDEKEEELLKSNLYILSLYRQSFKPHVSLNGLKFLNIRVECRLKKIEHLNQLNQLEFLDFCLPNKLTKKFNQVNLPKLKYLVLTCRNTPNFNESLKNLQGLEVINAKFTPRDQFINLKSLDYLAITDPKKSMFDKFCGTTFSTIKNLKFLKIESSNFEFFYEDDKRNEINEKLSKLFESPENVLFHDEICGNEILFEKVHINVYTIPFHPDLDLT